MNANIKYIIDSFKKFFKYRYYYVKAIKFEQIKIIMLNFIKNLIMKHRFL